MTAAGNWEITMQTPLGDQMAKLELVEKDGVLSGQTRDPKSGEVSTLTDVQQNGSHVHWKQSITKPMSMTVTFDVEVNGDSMSGKAKPGMLPAAKVTGRRIAGH